MFACIPCALCFENGRAQLQHTKSDFHAYNLRRRVAGDEPLLESEFDMRQQLLAETYSKAAKVKVAKTKAAAPAEKLTYAPNMSLFCNHVSSNFEENLAFMKKRYNFSFYGAQAVRDSEKLLNLLGNLIFVEQRCIWCDKKFANLQAVQTHMSAKGHRRQGHMYEEQIERYRPFYDPSLAKTRLMSTTSAAAEKIDEDDDWELVGEDDQALEDETEKTITSAYEILSPRTPETPLIPPSEAKVSCPGDLHTTQLDKVAVHRNTHNRAIATQRMTALAKLSTNKAYYYMDPAASQILLKQHHRLMCFNRMRRQNFNNRMKKKRIFAV